MFVGEVRGRGEQEVGMVFVLTGKRILAIYGLGARSFVSFVDKPN